jgi:hypothetical protein
VSTLANFLRKLKKAQKIAPPLLSLKDPQVAGKAIDMMREAKEASQQGQRRPGSC